MQDQNLRRVKNDELQKITCGKLGENHILYQGISFCSFCGHYDIHILQLYILATYSTTCIDRIFWGREKNQV